MNNQKWSGERLETFIKDITMMEHLHRYALALEIISDKIVLDIACGVGYGTFLMAQKAKSVTGIDIDNKTIIEANKNYKRDNLTFKIGSIELIPEKQNEFDIIICFETIEHISNHTIAIKELKRVLKPGGILLISTPDKFNYSDKFNSRNPFHKKELYESEFKSLISKKFKHVQYYKQTELVGSVIISETNKNKEFLYYFGNYDNINISRNLEAVYHIAFASDNVLPDFQNSIFYHEDKLERIIQSETDKLKRTKTYKIGNAIVNPVKRILSFFRK